MAERISYQTEINRLTNELRQTLGSTSTASFDVRDQLGIQQQMTSVSGNTSYISKEPVGSLSAGMPTYGTAMQQDIINQLNDLSRTSRSLGDKELPRADSGRTSTDRDKGLPRADSKVTVTDKDLYRTDGHLPSKDSGRTSTDRDKGLPTADSKVTGTDKDLYRTDGHLPSTDSSRTGTDRYA